MPKLEHDLLYLFHVDTGDFERLAEGNTARWMADGRRLFASVRGRKEFFVIDTVTKETWLVDAPDVQGIVLSPDNLRAYLSRIVSESGIWMVEMRQR